MERSVGQRRLRSASSAISGKKEASSVAEPRIDEA